MGNSDNGASTLNDRISKTFRSRSTTALSCVSNLIGNKRGTSSAMTVNSMRPFYSLQTDRCTNYANDLRLATHTTRSCLIGAFPADLKTVSPKTTCQPKKRGLCNEPILGRSVHHAFGWVCHHSTKLAGSQVSYSKSL